FPKGVMLTHKNLVSNTLMGVQWLYNCKEGEEVVLGVLPFFHVYGMTAVMNLSIMQGYKMLLNRFKNHFHIKFWNKNHFVSLHNT
ncbi:AMP-binding protein, partial [Bacillus sp. D-CC]